jgi:hypothetical protein
MMDASQFDTFARSLTGSRRSLLGGSLALATGWLGVSATDAKKKHKKRKPKKPKPKPNAYGCLEVSDPCQNAEQCCSGVCVGKKGKRQCRSHDSGTCDQALPGRCSNSPTLSTCNGSETCACIRTTANSSFCARLGATICSDCEKDADCAALGLPPGSACAPVSEGTCAGICAGGMACLLPCGAEIPEK